MTQSAPLRVRAVGREAVLVELDDPTGAADLAVWLRRRVDAVEVVPAARTVLIDGFDPDSIDVAALVARWRPAGEQQGGRLVTIPVVYDGADLEEVASCWRTDREGVVRRHTELEFTAAFCGFAPGFAYLSGLPADLVVPRLDSPRTRVPPGSVAIADRWCAVYPTPSPGGWRLLGRTDLNLWDVDRDPPALLAPGTRVRFEAVG